MIEKLALVLLFILATPYLIKILKNLYINYIYKLMEEARDLDSSLKMKIKNYEDDSKKRFKEKLSNLKKAEKHQEGQLRDIKNNILNNQPHEIRAVDSASLICQYESEAEYSAPTTTRYIKYVKVESDD